MRKVLLTRWGQHCKTSLLQQQHPGSLLHVLPGLIGRCGNGGYWGGHVGESWFLDGHAGPLECSQLHSAVFIPLLRLASQSFFTSAEKTPNKAASGQDIRSIPYFPVIAFKLGSVVMGQAHAAGPLCPWLSVEWGSGQAAHCVPRAAKPPVSISLAGGAACHITVTSSFSVLSPLPGFCPLQLW